MIHRPLVAAALSIAFAGALAGCDPKADKASCEKMSEHDFGILDESTRMSDNPTGKKLLEELKQKSTDACVKTWKKSQVDCHMNAKTTAEMDKCDEGK